MWSISDIPPTNRNQRPFEGTQNWPKLGHHTCRCRCLHHEPEKDGCIPRRSSCRHPTARSRVMSRHSNSVPSHPASRFLADAAKEHFRQPLSETPRAGSSRCFVVGHIRTPKWCVSAGQVLPTASDALAECIGVGRVSAAHGPGSAARAVARSGPAPSPTGA